MEEFIGQIWDDRYGCPGVYSIYRCVSCAQMMTTPPLSEEDLPGLYSKYYPRSDIDFESLEREAALVDKPYSAWRRWLAGTNNQGHYMARPGQRVLDIGSGSCLSLLELRHMGVETFAVETDPNVRAIADRYDLNVHIGSIHDTPFPNLSFDLITLNQVIEHVPDPGSLLRVVRDRLAPGGRVILSFPNAMSLQRWLTGTRWINWHVPYHQHHFNKRSIELLAYKEGYRVERASTVTPNLWSVLQLGSLRKPPAEGVASATWEGGGGADDVRTSFSTKVRLRLLRELHSLASPLLVPLNRIVDQLGLGDSLLIVLRKV